MSRLSTGDLNEGRIAARTRQAFQTSGGCVCVCVWGGGGPPPPPPPPPACTCTAAPRATASSGGTELHTSDEGNACCTSACPPKPSLKQAARHLMQTGATHPARAMRSAPD